MLDHQGKLIPPQAIDAEKCVLGAMILDGAVIDDVQETIGTSSVFWDVKHEMIYRAIVSSYEKGAPIDLVVLQQKLSDMGAIEQVGGIPYLVELAEGVPSSASAPHYAKIVRDKYRLRKLAEVGETIFKRAVTDNSDVASQVEQAEAEIFSIAESDVRTSDCKSIGEIVQEVFDELQRREKNTVTGVETGFYDLDDMLCGMQPGEMIVLAARPSIGKTMLMMNIVHHVAVHQNLPCLVFSLEMSRNAIAQRTMCSIAGIRSDDIRRNTLSEMDIAKLSLTVENISGSQIHVDDSTFLSISSIRAKARRMVARYGIKLIAIDYLQLLASTNKRENRQEDVAEISRGIKSLARELKVPILCLSQLNRMSEMRDKHRPRLSDLRESGALEQDADAVLLLHRESFYHIGEKEWQDENPDLINTAELIIAKQRNGPTGAITLHFNGESTTFSNLARGY